MTIELEKILTISARDYCEMYGKELNQYDARGIHCEGKNEIIWLDKGIIKQFSEVVPDNAEIVVEYRAYVAGQRCETDINLIIGASGTALIPKK
jgi:hypothetical protein